ncbi:MAG: VacJ family lipoprotein [Proteobacteria bacterium]|nr:VacJ family lipoprotein [Desulfobacula sp.]MBU4130219.1 VacJ family lipoprotein [Pseudomonadota bacterium]
MGIIFEVSSSQARDESIKIFPVIESPSENAILLAQNDVKTQDSAPLQEDPDLLEDFEEQIDGGKMVADPLYYFNYAMYSFNDFLYFYALKPLAQGYKLVTPTPLRNGVNNFFHNLLFPVRFVNNILQGKLVPASDEFGIFLVNSTAGILGFNQVAQKHLNMKTSDEDLGQTLGALSIGNGFYLVLPVLGPSTFRDAIGRAGDWFITPVNYVEPWEVNLGVSVIDKINRISFRIGDYEAMKEASLDPYVALRNAYIQNRNSEIAK